MRSRTSLPHRDRRALERGGWRTLLDYREDHIRDSDGALVAVVPRWTAEAEHTDGRVVAASVTEGDPEGVWRLLRRRVSAARAQQDPAARGHRDRLAHAGGADRHAITVHR
jgi:hypothetical protein